MKFLKEFYYHFHTHQRYEEDEFADLKINWLIKNQRTDLIENFLKQNKEFKSKSRAVQYLVDENIAKLILKKGVKK